MTLFTKSIQARKSESDGIRICIMRRPGDYNDADFDIWMPVLSPSHKLLDDFHSKKVDWSGYVSRFNKEVIERQGRYLKILTKVACKQDITLLCWEESPKQCHRRLVVEECMRINPKLKIVIK